MYDSHAPPPLYFVFLKLMILMLPPPYILSLKINNSHVPLIFCLLKINSSHSLPNILSSKN